MNSATSRAVRSSSRSCTCPRSGWTSSSRTFGAAATLLAEVPERFQYERDPDDAHYVNLALVARAKCIVSRDGDLLDLVHSPGDESVSFRARFPDLRIVDPVSFLSELG